MWKVVMVVLFFAPSVKAAVQHYFPASRQEIMDAITGLSPIGSLKAYTDAEVVSGLRKYFDLYGDCVVFFDWSGRAGQSLSYTYKNRVTYYHAVVIFTIKPRGSGVEVGVIMDDFAVEAGRRFNIHSFKFDAVNLRHVMPTGAEERVLLGEVASKLGMHYDVGPLPEPINIKK